MSFVLLPCLPLKAGPLASQGRVLRPGFAEGKPLPRSKKVQKESFEAAKLVQRQEQAKEFRTKKQELDAPLSCILRLNHSSKATAGLLVGVKVFPPYCNELIRLYVSL